MWTALLISVLLAASDNAGNPPIPAAQITTASAIRLDGELTEDVWQTAP